jgi:D-alanyl-lipoteichoic acid acyltransferase DltB (MBOAT superfamily)
MVVADNLAPVANMVFGRFASGHAGTASSAEVLVGLYAFAFQIYGDFSGYSSIARGISKWLGFDLVVNFDNPYLAFSPGDFWRRWHISLSTWLRDYLYIPLGGSRGGRLLTYRNLMITMLLGGLWHGANWTFVAWGLFHGLLLCFYRAMSRRGASLQNWLLRTAAVILMFHLTCIGWLLFRADTLDAAGRMLACLFVNWRMAAPGAAAILTLVAFYAGPLFLWESWLGGEAVLGLWLRRSFFGQVVVLTYLVVMLLLFRTENPCEFIYFQF